MPHPHASAKRPRTWLPLTLLALAYPLAYLLVLARMASDRYTNVAGAAATLLLWVLCAAFSLREAGVTLHTLRLRPRVATKSTSPATAVAPVRRGAAL